MEEDTSNKTLEPTVFQTPKLQNRTLQLRKNKSMGNCAKLEKEISTTSKKNYNSKTYFPILSRFLTHQRSVKQFHTVNEDKLMNNTFDGNNKKNKDKIKKLHKNENKDEINNTFPKNTNKENIGNHKKKMIKVERKEKKIKINDENKDKQNEENKINNEDKVKDNDKKENKNKKKQNKIKNENKKEDIEENKKQDIKNKKNLAIKKQNNFKNITNEKKIEIIKNNNKLYNTFDSKNEEKTTKEKKVNLKFNSINVIPLNKRQSTSPNSMKHNQNFTKRYLDDKTPPKSKKSTSFVEEKDKEERIKKEEQKEKKIKVIKKDKESINRNLLTPKKKEIKRNPLNTDNSNRNTINSAKPMSRVKHEQFLYLPHIVLDPLDVLKNQIEMILKQFDERLNNLNKTTKDESIQALIKKANEEYLIKLYELYDKKEEELIKIKNIYGPELYKLTLNKEEEKEEENKNKSEELIQKRDKEINEIENKFNEKKIELKNEFRNKLEEIKKTYDIEKQKTLNKELVDEIKKKFIKTFNDKKFMNKKGINFSLREYKNSMKNSKIKTNTLKDTSFIKK